MNDQIQRPPRLAHTTSTGRLTFTLTENKQQISIVDNATNLRIGSIPKEDFQFIAEVCIDSLEASEA